jgi:phosphatidylglycerophosphate synthase
MYWISIKELRVISQKTNYGYDIYPLMFRFIRVISIYFTWMLIQTKCKPNTITIFGVLFGVMSGVMCFLGFIGAGLILVVLAVIADFSDGEVSRFHGTTSKEGTYLDSIHHYVVQPFFIAGIVLWGFEGNGDKYFLAAGMVCVINSIILTLAVASAVENAILKHLLRTLSNNKPLSMQAKVVAASKNKNQKTKFYRKIPGAVARVMDFPYVIMIMGTSVFIACYGKASVFNINSSLLTYTIYTYAIITTNLICIFIWNVLHTKHIEKRVIEIETLLH